MKLTSRGFTLVELMIVIAIIGILAAALFPSMTAYLKRSRDAARVSGTKDISTAAGAYFADRERYPDATGDGAGGAATNGCAGTNSLTGLSTNYLPKGLPSDPTATNNNGCGGNGQYGYGSGNNATTFAGQFFVTSTFENVNGGNTGGILGYTGTNRTLGVVGLVKGAGQYYILSN